ncbi:hypothetical protein FYJ24_05020 [Actinomycetaceae bacterium WB03_NA08]|uniref:Uncharacterized protein n=1 Tax=Scrofimicrobium canadense TaxID=2652290 RepID=A0A6N7VQX2_9ACTO|nr:hypothetical protein [Scrofimicrobium canadense]MSS84137.1 hypothetical protein [Scrofimicrobium canadense]
MTVPSANLPVLKPVFCFPDRWLVIDLSEPGSIAVKIRDYADRNVLAPVDDETRRQICGRIQESVGAALDADAAIWAGALIPGEPFLFSLTCVVRCLSMPRNDAEELIETMLETGQDTEVFTSRLSRGIRQWIPLPPPELTSDAALAQEAVIYSLTDSKHDALLQLSFTLPVVKDKTVFTSLFDSIAGTWWLVNREKQ